MQALGGSVEVYQGKFASLVAGNRGRYHVGPLLSSFGRLIAEGGQPLQAAVAGPC